MSRLRSLRQKIAFMFFVITAAAFSAIWFVVVPQLEENLKERRLTSLQNEARDARAALQAPLQGGTSPSRRNFTVRIRQAADATDAQVTVMDWQRDWSPERNPGFYPVDDSKTSALVPFDEQLAQRALIRNRRQVGYGTSRDGDEIGMVAQPLTSTSRLPRVAFYSRDFDDVRETVAFVRDRVLLATSAALLIALFGGYLVAARLARRVGGLSEPPAMWRADASWSRSP